MPERKSPRLTFGEYHNPEIDTSTVQHARSELMLCVKRVFPQMLERLATDVFTAYQELANSGFNMEAILWQKVSPFKELPQGCSLRSALLKWAKEFHAEQDWFLDGTLRTLRGWHVAPEWRSERRWNPIGETFGLVPVCGSPFIVDFVPWDMQAITWADYSQWAQKEFKKRLAEYEAASREMAESHGLVRGPHKYSPKNLEWFVLYQFAGRSSTQIANGKAAQRYGDAESGILKGVKTAARAIEWDSLRPVPGRPHRKIRKPTNFPNS